MGYVNPVNLLTHCTVRIECQTGDGVSTGTGYFYEFFGTEKTHVPCIITNKHVIDGAEIGRFRLTLNDGNNNPKLGEYITIEFSQFEKEWLMHPDKEVDLAAFPLGRLIQEANKLGIEFHHVTISRKIIPSQRLYDSLSSMEEIVMIGYPIGLWDKKHNLPIFRRGITATHANLPLNGKTEFMIDAACFPGSSGSPVFLANIGSYLDEDGVLQDGSRIALLGTLYAGPQFTAKGKIEVVEVPTASVPIAFSDVPCNLGLVIHANRLNDFEPIIKSRMAGDSNA